MTHIESAASKLALAAAIAGVAFLRIRFSKRDADHWGFVRPPLRATLLWIAALLLWMLATDAVIGWRGPWDFGPWLAAPVAASVMRVLAICVLGPIAEELIFRSILFAKARALAGVAAAIVLTSAGWATLHWDYSWPVILVIFVDGLLLGCARWRTNSVWAPAAMHILYNLYAIW
jgi:membrane protease YdiL (CAAX protease family)